jgi:4-hydroxyphenylpyruvate dioxygenase
LWEQGAARILLNSGAGEGGAIRAFALESADPEQSARRAEHLLARPLPRRRRQTEADLTAVAAPDGTEVFFCRTEPVGAHGWLDDFLPTGEPRTPSSGITGVDHLSLAQPFDRFDEAALFYRTVLGMCDDEAGEFAAPFGLVRTLAIRSVDRRVRISLSVPVLRRGDWAPAVPHPQHVTLVTDDLPRTAAALSRAGAETLHIPDNYYDDLDARIDLRPQRRELLRRIGAMYDEDGHGQYLQLFTPVIGSRVFVEVVQRVGGYRGYGIANDPVRMAAHRSQRLEGAVKV